MNECQPQGGAITQRVDRQVGRRENEISVDIVTLLHAQLSRLSERDVLRDVVRIGENGVVRKPHVDVAGGKALVRVVVILARQSQVA